MSSQDTKLQGRILYIVNEDWAFLLNRLPMARAARDAGLEVHVATNVSSGAASIEAEGFVLHHIPFQRGQRAMPTAAATLKAIREIESKIKPSIVHHSGVQCCVFGSLAALDQTFPVVNAITGLGYIFTSSSSRSRLLKRVLTRLLPWLLNRDRSYTIVQNPDDREALLALGANPDRMSLIPGSGVDDESLQPLPEPEAPITVGFAGRLLVDKGIRTLVRAYDLLRDQGHDINLIIAGNPDSANPSSVSREEIDAWVARPGITWLGHIDNIVSLWRASHIAVLPSYREGLPGALMEAAACGRPLIATDTPGCREIVLSNQTGLLVPLEDPAALSAAILQLAESPELRASYGAAARRRVSERFSARIIGHAITRLYGDILTHGEILLATSNARTNPYTPSR
ncbi:glycosyltransferase family 4 protein [Bradyrhizobium tropiciagri]|uniref:glycosyltransferase family 4 protein n=1 Tax=Bradyrhizobium tropiciagri TaxID=312253 RepID=UPI001BACCE91|nr:glycosyltransferase family 4 protein [Bradyrhizobium tropiciagri]MBR0896500.1 glycosyltransferase family 4 protein [Bradyrhizobium tropiciagri]